MGEIHAACIRSFVRHGHQPVLHCYEPPEDLHESIEVFDAAHLMPKSELLADKASGSVALGSDRYRYRMLRAGMGTYSDCDMFLLRPLPDLPYLIGQQHNWDQYHACNGALLRYPQDSELAQQLVKCTLDDRVAPPWSSRSRRLTNKARAMAGIPASVTKGPWGEWGPRLVSYWVEILGLQHQTQAIDVFYPLHYASTSLLFDPGLTLDDLVTSRTVAVHLSHKMLSRDKIPQGCPLDVILKSAE